MTRPVAGKVAPEVGAPFFVADNVSGCPQPAVSPLSTVPIQARQDLPGILEKPQKDIDKAVMFEIFL